MFFDDKQGGVITSAGYGRRAQKIIAYAFVKVDRSTEGTKLAVGILSERFQAEVCAACSYNSQIKLLKS